MIFKFCKDFIPEVIKPKKQGDFVWNEIDFEKAKAHIEKCDFCAKELTNLLDSSLNNKSILKLLKVFR